MENIIVASFKEEKKAIDALHALIESESLGDITIYEKIMVRKKAGGDFEILKEDTADGWRMVAGMGIGSLVGMIGGPVGFIFGLYTGTAVGALAELGHYDFAEDFVRKVENKMAEGTISIIAEVDEDNNVFVDTTLKPFGAVILRSDVDFAYDKYVDEQIEEIDEEIADKRAQLKKAVGDDRKKIENKIAELKKKRKEKIAEFTEKRRAAEKNIKDKATAGMAKIKSDVRGFENSVTQELKEEREERIKRRIVRHEEKLNALNKQLKGLQAS